MQERVQVTRPVQASASDVFRIVSDPAGHVAVDGSGMLTGVSRGAPCTGVGETFTLHMDRAPLGDIPEMGVYKARNTVTRFEQDRLFEWRVGDLGHVYGWEITPTGPSSCEATNYCDWSGVSEQHKAHPWPVVPVHMLEGTVERLVQVAESGAWPPA